MRCLTQLTPRHGVVRCALAVVQHQRLPLCVVPPSRRPSRMVNLASSMATSTSDADIGLGQMRVHDQGPRYVDVGINLSDAVFRGSYRGKQAHADDLDAVIARAQAAGVQKMMVTGSDLHESLAAVEIASKYPGLCYATVGVHPCSATAFDTHAGGPAALLSLLVDVAQEGARNGTVVACGEIGLDYDRLSHAPKEQQKLHFEAQLDAFAQLTPSLPLFLHMRAAAEDFEDILVPKLDLFPRKGLVHSFTGSEEEMQRLLDLGLDIGVNGCSLKTEENLLVVAKIPLDRLQIETDGPWCEIRPSHASYRLLDGAPVMPNAFKKEKFVQGMMVKGRNEPCTIPLVAHVIAKLKDISPAQVCEAAWNNSIKMFGLGERIEE